MPQKLTKIIALFLCLCLVFEQVGFAQLASLNIAGYLSAISSQPTDKFRPLHLRSLAYDNQNNNFKLLIDKGDFFKQATNGSDKSDPYRRTADASHSVGARFIAPEKRVSTSVGAPFMAPAEGARNTNVGTRFIAPETTALEQETKKLMEYFYIGLALPNDAFWVNLRPDADLRGPSEMNPNGSRRSVSEVIDSDLAKTDIGRIMLETDVQLKKDTARMTSPETPEGKLYWDKLYKKAEELFGTENITIPTLTRPWIVPNEIIIRESKDSAYIYKATLKVMIEEDYFKASPWSWSRVTRA